MRLLVPLALIVVSSACDATPEKYCQDAYQRCLRDAGWSTADVNECEYDWETYTTEAEVAGCEEPFRDYFNCRQAEAYCWEEERDGSYWTIYGIDDYVCASEWDAYYACMYE